MRNSWALYRSAISSTPAFKSSNTPSSCRSHTGPRGAYKNVVPMTGTVWINTPTAPTIPPSWFRETTASKPQLFFTFRQRALWVNPPFEWRLTKFSYSSYCSGFNISNPKFPPAIFLYSIHIHLLQTCISLSLFRIFCRILTNIPIYPAFYANC